MSDKATLRPWKVNRREVEFEIDGQIGSISNYQIVTAWNHPQLKAPEVIIGISQRYGGPTITTREANARYIVKACNAYDDLVRELKAREWCDDGDKFGPHCQTCGNWKSSGHSPGCKLKAVLDLCEVQE